MILQDMNGKIRKQTDVLPNELIDIKELGKGYYMIELQISKDIKRLKLITF